MRKTVFFLCFVLLLLTRFPSFAQAPDSSKPTTGDSLPPILVSGLNAYKEKGPDEAVRAWIKGSGIEDSKEALSQANLLRQIQDYYGAYQGFDVLSTKNPSPRTRVFYLTLNFEKGPLFVKFVTYRTDKDWILAYFNSATKEEQILPACK
jgi:hypothetical protein